MRASKARDDGGCSLRRPSPLKATGIACGMAKPGNIVACAAGTPNATDSLKQLSEHNVTECTAGDVAEDLENILNSVNETVLSVDDIHYATTVIEKLGLLKKIDEKTMDDVCDSIQKLLETNEEAFVTCDALYGCGEKISKFFENAQIDFKLEERNPWLFSGRNFAFAYMNNLQMTGESFGLAVSPAGTARLLNSTTGTVIDEKMFISFEPVHTSPRMDWPPVYGISENFTTKFMVYTGRRPISIPTEPVQADDRCSVTHVAQSHVMSASLTFSNGSQLSHLQGYAVGFGARLTVTERSLHSTDVCGYRLGQTWSSEGCSLVSIENDFALCKCYHLSDFAVLVEIRQNDPGLCDPFLQTLNDVILLISISSLSLTLFLLNLEVLGAKKLLNRFQLCRGMKKYILPRNRAPSPTGIWNMVSLFFFELSFILFIDGSNLEVDDDPMVCSRLAAISYFLLLFYIMWCSFVALKLLHDYYFVYGSSAVQKMLNTRVLLLFSSTICVIIVIVCWCFDEKFFLRNDGSCWIRPNYVGLATFLPISILIIADFVITALLTKALFCTNSVRRHSSKTSRRRTMMAKVFLLVSTQFILGAPWVIQYFTINTPYVNGARYAFTVINGLQGFWISSIYFSTYVVFLVQKSRKSKSAPIRTITFVTMTTSSAK